MTDRERMLKMYIGYGTDDNGEDISVELYNTIEECLNKIIEDYSNCENEYLTDWFDKIKSDARYDLETHSRFYARNTNNGYGWTYECRYLEVNNSKNAENADESKEYENTKNSSDSENSWSSEYVEPGYCRLCEADHDIKPCVTCEKKFCVYCRVECNYPKCGKWHCERCSTSLRGEFVSPGDAWVVYCDKHPKNYSSM